MTTTTTITSTISNDLVMHRGIFADTAYLERVNKTGIRAPSAEGAFIRKYSESNHGWTQRG